MLQSSIGYRYIISGEERGVSITDTSHDLLGVFAKPKLKRIFDYLNINPMAQTPFDSFIRSMIRELGRNTGKAISNKVFGDAHATPVRHIKGSAPESEKSPKKDNISRTTVVIVICFIVGIILALVASGD